MLVPSPGCYLCFWLTGYKSEVFRRPSSSSSGLINLIVWLRTQTNVLLARLPIYYKGIQCRNSQIEDMCRAGYKQMTQIFYALSRHSALPSLHVFTNQKGLWIPSFGGFMEVSLHRQDWLNLLAIGGSINLQALSLPWWSESRIENSNPLILQLTSLITSPHPKVFSESHLNNITKDTFITPNT